jgi:hypothetical protein
MSKAQQHAFDQWLKTMVDNHKAAASRGTWDGRSMTPYSHSCRHAHSLRGIGSIMTREVGYHSSGWYKNPDFERCVHLSLSFYDPATLQPKPHDHAIASKIVKAMFFPHAKYVLVEPPRYNLGKKHDVHHYRMFCDEHWQPIKPRGEVYSTELTELGWKSFSDVQEAVAETGVNPNISK